jgi:hypothetical protein
MEHHGAKRYLSLGFSNLPHMPILPSLLPKTSIMMDDIMVMMGDVLGLPRPMFH